MIRRTSSLLTMFNVHVVKRDRTCTSCIIIDSSSNKQTCCSKQTSYIIYQLSNSKQQTACCNHHIIHYIYHDPPYTDPHRTVRVCILWMVDTQHTNWHYWHVDTIYSLILTYHDNNINIVTRTHTFNWCGIYLYYTYCHIVYYQ